MNPIEAKIREALAAAPSRDMDSRNRIYLAVRAAILKQKNGHSDISMKALFDGITNIEREFTTGKKTTPPQTANKRLSEPETASPSIVPLAQTEKVQLSKIGSFKSLLNFNNPSQKNIASTLLVMAGVSVFLFASFMFATGDVTIRGSSLQDVGVATLFSVELPSDWEKLTDNPSALRLDGNTVVVEAPNQRNKTAKLYGRELIAVSPGQEFLMRVEFQSETGGAGPGVRAGFVSYDSNGEALSKEPENYLFFVESAALGDRYYNETTGNYVMSGLLIPDAPYKNLRIPPDTRQIRPVIQIIANGNKGKYRISRISVKRIE